MTITYLRCEAPMIMGRRSARPKPSTALRHEHEVGVKWNTKRSCRSSQAWTLGCFWAACPATRTVGGLSHQHERHHRYDQQFRYQPASKDYIGTFSYELL
jgi:hypothetical protein